MENFIYWGIYFSFVGTLAAAILSFLNIFKYSVVLSFLAGVTGLGAVASAFMLYQQKIFIELNILSMPLRLDNLSAWFFLIVTAIGCLASIYAISYLKHGHYNLPVANGLLGLFILGMQGLLLANNSLLFMFFWEVMSVSSFFLVMAEKSQSSVRAALFYLIMAQLGAGTILSGLVIISGGQLALKFSDLEALGTAGINQGWLTAAFGLFLFGFASKAGLVPFHVWLPEAHPQAPSHVSALMSGVMLKMAVYGFLKVLTIFSWVAPFWSWVIIGLGLLSAIYGVLYSILEIDVKKVLAYSSIENLGIIFILFGFFLHAIQNQLNPLGQLLLSLIFFQSLCHALFKAGLFFGAGVLVGSVGSRSLEVMGGLAKRMPAFSVGMALLSFAAAALPPFGAFVTEMIFIQEMIRTLTAGSVFTKSAALVVLSAIGLIGGLAIFSMIRLFAIAFLGEPRSAKAQEAQGVDKFMSVPILILASASFLVGVFSASVFKFLDGSLNLGLGVIFQNNFNFGGFNLAMLLVIFLAIFLALYILRNLLSRPENERVYHTWDCGQPINSTMEYTATAFSGPIRFFFRPFLKTNKQLSKQPVIATNSWITEKTLVIDNRSIWYDYFYLPIINGVLFVSSWARKIQNGFIQFYLGLILAALAITLVIVL